MSSSLTPPIRWPAEALWEALAPVLPGFTVEVLPQIDSTNTELMRRFRGSPSGSGGPAVEPRPEPLLLVAEQQTAGRGRLGRSWQSRRGASLTFSLGLPLAPADWSGLSLVAGISVAESLDPANLRTPGSSRIGLKWPNDLWLCSQTACGTLERKLGGILVETASWDGLRHVVIGVGINILPLELAPSGAASPLGAMPPGCLQALLPGVEAPQALLRIVPPLVQAVQAFAQFGFAPFQSRFAARDVLAGRAVQLSGGPLPVEGTAHGAGENGALLVHTAAGMKEITSSEVSVRPVTAATPPREAPPC